MFQEENEEKDFMHKFKNSSCQRQLELLENLLNTSQPEVKYKFQLKIEDITKYDIISELPIEIAEYIFMYLDLSTILRCRIISQHWKDRVEHCDKLWLPYLQKFCIDSDGFRTYEECWRKTIKSKPDKKEEYSDVIGERLFNLSVSSSSSDLKVTPCVSNSFLMGRKLIGNLEKQAGLDCVIDHDCRGSNVVMTMNSQIIAYAREDRHIVVKYTNFPHKKICVFEAHQCADIKIHGDQLITGGYDRSICIWEWDNGSLVHCLKGSIKPVYSLDVSGTLLISSDGKSVILWNLKSYKMIMRAACFQDGSVEELKIIHPTTSNSLSAVYSDLLLVVRSNQSLKVMSCTESGTITFLSNLTFTEEISNLQPFIQVHRDTIACSSDHGILVWNLRDFTLVKHIKRDSCHACMFSVRTAVFPRSNCRVILLYYSESLALQYFVHKNRFQLYGVRDESSVDLSWNFPSDEKWPWSHRKPGLASLVLNMDSGFSMNTKITLFVATQGKKIYCMLFDASDLNYTMDSNLSVYERSAEKSLFEESI